MSTPQNPFRKTKREQLEADHKQFLAEYIAVSEQIRTELSGATRVKLKEIQRKLEEDIQRVENDLKSLSEQDTSPVTEDAQPSVKQNPPMSAPEDMPINKTEKTPDHPQLLAPDTTTQRTEPRTPPTGALEKPPLDEPERKPPVVQQSLSSGTATEAAPRPEDTVTTQNPSCWSRFRNLILGATFIGLGGLIVAVVSAILSLFTAECGSPITRQPFFKEALYTHCELTPTPTLHASPVVTPTATPTETEEQTATDTATITVTSTNPPTAVSMLQPTLAPTSSKTPRPVLTSTISSSPTATETVLPLSTSTPNCGATLLDVEITNENIDALLNTHRCNLGLSPLAPNENLTDVANQYVQDIRGLSDESLLERTERGTVKLYSGEIPLDVKARQAGYMQAVTILVVTKSEAIFLEDIIARAMEDAVGLDAPSYTTYGFYIAEGQLNQRRNAVLILGQGKN